MREDGSAKVRPIDDMSASGNEQTQVAFTKGYTVCMCLAGINDATGVREKLSYSTLDSLFDALQDMARCTKVEIAVALQYMHGRNVNTMFAGAPGAI